MVTILSSKFKIINHGQKNLALLTSNHLDKKNKKIYISLIIAKITFLKLFQNRKY